MTPQYNPNDGPEPSKEQIRAVLAKADESGRAAFQPIPLWIRIAVLIPLSLYAAYQIGALIVAGAKP